MAVDEAARHELYSRLEEALGPGPTGTLMDLLPPTGWSDVVRARDLDALRADLRTEMADLRADVATGMRRQTLTLVGTMVTISGVTVAATRLL